jgi:8-oxo-dGTP pyrophosphatase MutT (NUDIX family)
MLYRVARVGIRGVRRVQFGSYTIGSLVILTNSAESLLIVRPRFGQGWSLPGGFQKRSEAPLETAIRELEEETGLVGLALEAVGQRFQTGAKHIDFVFVSRLPADASFEQRCSLEIADVRAVPLPEAWKLLNLEGRDAYRYAVAHGADVPPPPE